MTDKYDSTGAMCSAWFGTSAPAAVEAIFGNKVVSEEDRSPAPIELSASGPVLSIANTGAIFSIRENGTSIMESEMKSKIVTVNSWDEYRKEIEEIAIDHRGWKITINGLIMDFPIRVKICAFERLYLNQELMITVAEVTGSSELQEGN